MDTSQDGGSSIEKEEEKKHKSNYCMYFLVDGSKKMFEINPETGDDGRPAVTYFEESLQAYKELIRNHCMWNHKNYVGLIIYNVSTSNENPPLKNCSIHTELAEVYSGMATDIYETIRRRMDDYKNISFDEPSSLLEAMKHVENKMSEVKKSMYFKTMVLLTCDDNPLAEDEPERHKIRLVAKRMAMVNLELRVVGLKSDWNEELFWKDIEMLFQTEWRPYKKTAIYELIANLEKPARIYRTTTLNVCNALNIPISLYLCSQKKKYLKSVPMHKSTGLPLKRHVFYKKCRAEEDEDEDDSEWVPTSIDDVTYKAKYAGQSAVFTYREKKQPVQDDKNLKVVGFKPAGKFNPEFHFKAPYFVTLTSKSTKGERDQFHAFLKRCAAKEVMGMSSMTLFTKPKMYMLIPCLEKGGFYLSAIPFKNQVRNLRHIKSAKNFFFASNNTECPKDEECISMWQTMIKKTRLNKSLLNFNSPKLSYQMAYLEAYAMDLEQPVIPEDNTKPWVELIRQRLLEANDAMGRYMELYPTIVPRVREKKRTILDLSKESLDEIVRQNRLQKCTVAELKAYLTILNLSVTGRKPDLINRISTHYQN